MKKLLILLVTLFSLAAKAQVDNYGLHFTSEAGVANMGKIISVTTGNSYTIQFWFCPDEWSKGAALMRSGQFSIKLGNNHALVINDGTNHLTITSSALAAGKWCQFTMRCDTTTHTTSVTLNNSSTYEGKFFLTLPFKEKSLWLGGGYKGRMDEVRLWRGILSTDHESFYSNTINTLCPQYWDLACYWKMDQEQCPNLVNSRNTRLHGTLSPEGVKKEKITDNPCMKYRIQLGYGNVERFFDRSIDAQHYGLLANHVSILGVWTYEDGSARVYSYNDAGTATEGANYLAEANGRSGVLDLTTEAATMQMAQSCLPSDASAYTVECWVMIDEWKEGACILQKKQDDTHELSIKLGEQGKIVATLNGKQMPIAYNVEVGKWKHIALTNGTFNSNVAIGLGSAKLVVGEGMKGKIDDLLIWTSQRSDAQIEADATTIPYPGPTTQLGTWDWYQMAACYDFAKPDDPGFDRYSVQGYIDHMRQLAGNLRGAKYTVTAIQPNNNALDATMADEAKREKMGKALAEIANDPYFDGIDIDFEWTYSLAGWTNIAKMLHIARQNMKPGKILSVSPHNVTYQYPLEYMSDIDYFNFQQYGPQETHSYYDTFTSFAQKFVDYGYPKDKIVLSYATTTAKGSNGSAIQGYRYICGGFDDDTDVYTDSNGESFHINSLNQVVARTKYARDNDMAGIMYWDMCNDRPYNDEKSFARASNFVISSNCEALVTEVSTAASLPSEDESAPEETEDPEDQGGSDEESMPLTTIDELDANQKGLNIINANGLGMIYSNASSSNLWLAESSNSNFSGSTDHEAAEAIWLIIKNEGKYYLYNTARNEFVTVPNFNVTSQPCTFTTAPAPLEVTCSGGTFAFRTYGSTEEKGYMCAAPQLTSKPVAQWTISDNGSQWQLVTIPLFDVQSSLQKAKEALGIDTAIDDIISTPSETEPVIYNINGQRVARPVRGINIINGRKVAIMR